jgi:CRP-like cAMP-binding protein
MTPEELASFSLFDKLTRVQLGQIAVISRPVTFATGRLIIAEGRTADRCWLIRSGRIALETRRPNGKSRTVQTLGEGDVLGWSWLVPPYRWTYDCVALDDVSAIEIDAVQLRDAVEQDCAFGHAILLRFVEVLADRLHGAHARLTDIYGNPRAD